MATLMMIFAAFNTQAARRRVTNAGGHHWLRQQLPLSEAVLTRLLKDAGRVFDKQRCLALLTEL